MTVLIQARYKVQCPAHPRYNAEKGAPESMCAMCWEISNMFQLTHRIHESFDRFATLSADFRAAKTSGVKP